MRPRRSRRRGRILLGLRLDAIKCKTCGRVYDRYDIRCPDCGTPNREDRGGGRKVCVSCRIFAGVSVLLLIFWLYVFCTRVL